MKFVHIADMHFDSPFVNLSDKEGRRFKKITTKKSVKKSNRIYKRK